MKTTSNEDNLKNEDDLKNEDGQKIKINSKMMRPKYEDKLYIKTTSYWKKPDLEDRAQPELTQTLVVLVYVYVINFLLQEGLR